MQDSVSSVSKPVCLFLVLCFLTAYVLPLSQRLFFEPDETRYAEISREMADGGGWLKLRLLGLPYYEKPPLGYWLGAASMSLFGREPWAARLPAALAASGAALAVFMLLRACARGRSEDGTAQGLTAAVIYLSFFEVFGVGTFITLDSLFTFFITLCMAAFFTATQTPPGRAKTARLTLAGLACACAFLTKGFIALVIPMLTLGLWLPWQGLLKRYMGACLQALAATVLAVLPVALVIHAHNPDFWRYFFWVEHVQRFLAPGNGQHEQPFWYYLPVLLGGALPWSFFLPQACEVIKARAATGDALTRFCLAWLILPLVFFSACGGKIMTYILPCFAPLAVLLAGALHDSPKDFRKAGWVCAVLLLVLALAGAVFLAGVDIPGDPALSRALRGDIKSWVLAAVLGLSAAGLLWGAGAFRPGGPYRSLAPALFALPLVPLFMASFCALPEAAGFRKTPSAILEKAVRLTPQEAFILADRKTLTAAAWHYRRADVAFAFDQGELAYGLRRAGAQERCPAAPAEAAALMQSHLAAGRAVSLIMARNRFEPLRREIAHLAPERELTWGNFIWRLYQP